MGRPHPRTVNAGCESLQCIHAEVTLAPPRRAHAGENPATAAAAIIFFYVFPRSQQRQAETAALKVGEDVGEGRGRSDILFAYRGKRSTSERAPSPHSSTIQSTFYFTWARWRLMLQRRRYTQLRHRIKSSQMHVTHTQTLKMLTLRDSASIPVFFLFFHYRGSRS